MALERKLIRRSYSRYTSPLLLVPKPPDGFRVTQDVSILNGCLAKIHAHIPVTHKLVAQIGGKKNYAQNDMVDAQYQFRVHPSVSELYAFSTHMGNFACSTRVACDVIKKSWTFSRDHWSAGTKLHTSEKVASVVVGEHQHVNAGDMFPRVDKCISHSGGYEP